MFLLLSYNKATRRCDSSGPWGHLVSSLQAAYQSLPGPWRSSYRASGTPATPPLTLTLHRWKAASGRPSYWALRPWLPAEGVARFRKRRLGEQNSVFGMLELLDAFHMAAGAGGLARPRGPREGDGLWQSAAPPSGPCQPLPAGRHIYLGSFTVCLPSALCWDVEH